MPADPQSTRFLFHCVPVVSVLIEATSSSVISAPAFFHRHLHVRCNIHNCISAYPSATVCVTTPALTLGSHCAQAHCAAAWLAIKSAQAPNHRWLRQSTRGSQTWPVAGGRSGCCLTEVLLVCAMCFDHHWVTPSDGCATDWHVQLT
jgi:hypothetical protein